MNFSLNEISDSYLDQINNLGEWQQIVRLGPNISTPGIWSSEDLCAILLHEFPASFWIGKRVLDIGANSGGLTLELIRLGALVTAVEPYEPFRNKIVWWKNILNVPDSHLKIIDTTLFNCQSLGQFDVILCLGLIYHFRHPQLVLDYLGNLDAKHMIISTQTYKSDKDVMINRSEVTPQWVSPARPLVGWHFSRSLFIKMLTLAGFKNPRSINHLLTLKDYEDNLSKTITNTGYFAAEFGNPVNVKAKSEEFI